MKYRKFKNRREDRGRKERRRGNKRKGVREGGEGKVEGEGKGMKKSI